MQRDLGPVRRDRIVAWTWTEVVKTCSRGRFDGRTDRIAAGIDVSRVRAKSAWLLALLPGLLEG